MVVRLQPGPVPGDYCRPQEWQTRILRRDSSPLSPPTLPPPMQSLEWETPHNGCKQTENDGVRGGLDFNLSS